MGDDEKKGEHWGGARKGAGRPPKTKRSEVLSASILFPCTEADKARWAKTAENARLSLAAWIRARLG